MKSPGHVLRTFWNYAPWALRELARHGIPRHLLHFYGQTPGDDLMCTAVLRAMRERGFERVWMMSRFPALFDGNTDVDQVVPYDFRYQRLVNWVGGQTAYAHYGGHDAVADRSPIPQQHIIALMCEACGLSGSVTLRPYLHLTEAERAGGRRGVNQIALHSSGQSAFTAMKNKEWFHDRLQTVVNNLRDDFTLVQLGADTDPTLDGCIDLRGRTTIRESAAVIANSEIFLGQVGFLMHLARAVNTRAVIIYGGREMPWQSGYSCNTNLYTPLYCSPCWRWNQCDNPVERQCLRLIEADEVIRAVRETAERVKEPLTQDTAIIGSSHALQSAGTS